VFEQRAERRGGQPLAEGADHPARHENVLHGISGSQGAHRIASGKLPVRTIVSHGRRPAAGSAERRPARDLAPSPFPPGGAAKAGRGHPVKYRYAARISTRTMAEATTSRADQLARDSARCSGVIVAKVSPWICPSDGGAVAQLTAIITITQTIRISMLKYWK